MQYIVFSSCHLAMSSPLNSDDENSIGTVNSVSFQDLEAVFDHAHVREQFCRLGRTLASNLERKRMAQLALLCIILIIYSFVIFFTIFELANGYCLLLVFPGMIFLLVSTAYCMHRPSVIKWILVATIMMLLAAFMKYTSATCQLFIKDWENVMGSPEKLSTVLTLHRNSMIMQAILSLDVGCCFIRTGYDRNAVFRGLQFAFQLFSAIFFWKSAYFYVTDYMQVVSRNISAVYVMKILVLEIRIIRKITGGNGLRMRNIMLLLMCFLILYNVNVLVPDKTYFSSSPPLSDDIRKLLERIRIASVTSRQYTGREYVSGIWSETQTVLGNLSMDPSY